ncbi:MAG TPA: DUF998 domain-containing protein [Candidatus Dormibacteraeota bacterium]|nr:DUF998 domain-containing protein [Candidatus Dormibacteraeota bacterium]
MSARSWRPAAVVGVVVPPLSVLWLTVDAWVSPGYDPVRQTVSRLAEPGAPRAALAGVALAALGLSVLAVSWELGRRVTSAAAPRALAGAGLAFLGVAAVARDPGRPALFVTHRVIALSLFLSLTLAPLLTARALRSDPAWRGLAAASLAASALSLALLVLAVVLLLAGALPAGVWERTFAGVGLAWVTLVAARLARPGSEPAAARRDAAAVSLTRR